MTKFAKRNEGSMHRKLRYTRYKYRFFLGITATIGVVAVAAALSIPAHSDVVENKISVDPVLNAGITRTLSETLVENLDHTKECELADLNQFSKNTDWAQDSFSSYVSKFEDWCFSTPQLTITLKHTYTIGEHVVSLADITNVVNIAHSTGYVTAMKPKYSMDMYYDYNNVDYYVTAVNADDAASPWVHVTTESPTDVLDFCQSSVISTTSPNTIELILKKIVQSGNYNTQDSVYDAYNVSWCGDLSDQLLAPTFSAANDDYTTRVDFSSFGDMVYCIVTYLYQNNTAGINEECYNYTVNRSQQVFNWQLPEVATKNAMYDASVLESIIEDL